MRQTKTIDGDIVLAPYIKSATPPYPNAEELARLKAETFALCDKYGIEEGRWYPCSHRIDKDGHPYKGEGECWTLYRCVKLSVRKSTGEGKDVAWPKGERIYFWDELHRHIACNENEPDSAVQFPPVWLTTPDRAAEIADILNEENAEFYRN